MSHQSISTLPIDEVTQYLIKIGNGDMEASRLAFPFIYKELQNIARSVRFRFHGLETLNTTAIVHEAYLKLSDNGTQWKSSSHFFCVAAKAMRQILLNAARNKHAEKRGGMVITERLDDFSETLALSTEATEKLIHFDDVLKRLEEQDHLYGRIVECRFFAGLSIEDTAEALNVSPATIKRKWQMARDWLYVHVS